jgi:hypothetical protein
MKLLMNFQAIFNSYRRLLEGRERREFSSPTDQEKNQPIPFKRGRRGEEQRAKSDLSQEEERKMRSIWSLSLFSLLNSFSIIILGTKLNSCHENPILNTIEDANECDIGPAVSLVWQTSQTQGR